MSLLAQSLTCRHLQWLWFNVPPPVFPSFSDTLSSSETHTAKCGGFPERVAQNSARHRLLYCGCKHLHREFLFALSVSTSFNSFLSLWIILLILPNSPFTEHITIIHSEWNLQRRWVLFCFFIFFKYCSDSLQMWSAVNLRLICVTSVFQLLLMVNPESPPWPSLESSSRSQQGTLGRFSEFPVVSHNSVVLNIFPEEGQKIVLSYQRFPSV